MRPYELEVMTLKGLAGTAAVSATDAATQLDESGVTAGDFTDARTQALFVALEGLIRDGQPPELVTLLRLAGPKVPRALTLDVLDSAELGVATRRLSALREAAQRRQTAEALRNLANLYDRDGVTLDAANGELHRVVAGLTEGSVGVRSGEYLAMELMHQLEAVQMGLKEPVLPTGIEALDAVIGGLQPTLTVVGSLPSVGKSALIATILSNVAKRGTKVGLLSLEDTADWVARRLAAEHSGIPVPVLAFKRLGTNQLQRAGASLEALYQPLRNLMLDDRHGLTTAEVVASARRMVSRGCKAIFVDHLGEIRLERSERHDLDITDALRELRAIAKTYGVAVVVACHLRRREGLDARTEPKLTDFAFSSGVERMARVALGLWREEEHLVVSVLKQTQGIANLGIRLNMVKSAGVVAPTPPSAALREELRSLWGDEHAL